MKVIVAYFDQETFLGWKSDSFGNISNDYAKEYTYSEDLFKDQLEGFNGTLAIGGRIGIWSGVLRGWDRLVNSSNPSIRLVDAAKFGAIPTEFLV